MNKTGRILLIVVALALIGGGAFFALRGRGPGTPAAAGFTAVDALPKQPTLALVIPDPSRLGAELGRITRLQLAGMAAGMGGVGTPEAFLDGVAKEAGFDLRSPESLKASGIAPDRPVAVAMLHNQPALLAFQIADGAKVEALLANHAKKRLGAEARGETKSGAHTVITWSSGKPNTPTLSYGVREGHALVAAGTGSEAIVTAALARPRTESLAAEPRYEAVAKKLDGSLAFAFLPQGSPLARASALLPYGLGAGLQVTPQALRLRLEVPLTEDQLVSFGSLAKADGKELLGALDPDAFFAARVGGEPEKIGPLLKTLTPQFLLNTLKRGNLDLDSEILANLKPGMAVSMRLAPTAELSSVPELDPRRTNPFKYLHLSALAQPKDAAKARETLGKVAAIAPRFGSKISEREVEGTKVYVATYHLGEGASFAGTDSHVLISGGEGRMEALFDRLKTGKGLELGDAAAKQAFETEGFVFFLDLTRLVASVNSLPDSAYGVGGFAIKAAISRWLSAVEELKAVTLAGRVEDKALRIDLSVAVPEASGKTAAATGAEAGSP